METNGHKTSLTGRGLELPAGPRSGAPPKKRGGAGRYLFFTLILLLILGGVVGIVLFRQHQAQTELAAQTRAMVIPTVLVVHPEEGSADVQVTLPGTVEAFMETPIYARVDGYLKRWLVDIGGHVAQGQLLAEIETPETDQQLVQAQAAQAQAEVDLKLAQSTADRWEKLLESKSVSQQESDEKNSDFEAKKASVNSAAANVKRLSELQSFQKVYAPFEGVLTERTVDVGNLINSGSGSSSKVLFRVAQIKTLRVYVDIPEYLSAMVIPGTVARIELASAPSQKVEGKLVRTSGAIDPSTLTLKAEVDVDNAEGKLLPGGYAQVHFDVVSQQRPLLIPANTLIFRAQGAQVGVVDEATGTVHLADIKIGRDFGTKLEVIQGLSKSDSVILNPADSLVDGNKVQIGK